ncbi:MAG: penicillin-binding protein activator LpoB, partial [Treponema sp.]|nr:penicillin-binding protein activator LpoB [Treponema sp.]
MMNLTNRAGLVLSGILFLACGSAPAPEAPASTPAPVTVVSLDTAAREAAARMDTRLPPKTKIALVSVGSSSAQLSEYIISQVEAALVESGKLVVVDRANLDKIRQEQGFQYSGDVSDESAKAIGKLLGAGAIVTGSFSDLGEVYHLALKAINMETAAVAVSYPADVAKSARITAMLASGGGAGTGVYGGTAAKPGAAPAAAPAPVQAVPAQAP